MITTQLNFNAPRLHSYHHPSKCNAIKSVSFRSQVKIRFHGIMGLKPLQNKGVYVFLTQSILMLVATFPINGGEIFRVLISHAKQVAKYD